MNKFIREQLEKSKVANIPEYDENSTQIYIDGVRKDQVLQFGKYYRLTLENYIVNPPPNFDLATNWNNGTKPTDPVINVEIVQATTPNLEEAKMIKISGRCEPSGDMWTGWIPKKSIIRIEEIK